MKELFRNPIFYYVAAPLLVAVWPLTVALKYLPKMDESLEDQKTYYVESQALIGEILTLDPDRLSYADAPDGEAFSYAVVIDKMADNLGIQNAYTLNEQVRTKEGQKAKVKLEDINIQQCTTFLATLQMRWDNLTCSQFTLTKKKKVKDQWTVTMSLAYTD